MDYAGKASSVTESLDDALIYCVESIRPRKDDGKDAEMTQQARVDCEVPGSGIHAGNVLDIVDFLECHLDAVVPVIVYTVNVQIFMVTIFRELNF